MRTARFVALSLVLFFAALTPAWGASSPGEALRLLPVLDEGRIKPYDTFANEVLENIYGKKTYEGRPAWEIVLTWMLAPGVWAEKDIFELRQHEILKELGLPLDRRWYKGDEIFGEERFPELMQELRAQRESKEKLTPYFQALQRLENQYFIFQEMATGRLLRLLPLEGPEATWIAVADFDGEARDKFTELSQAYVAWLGTRTTGGDEAAAGRALDEKVQAFADFTRTQAPQSMAEIGSRMSWEVHYNDFHPFRWAYILYLIAALILMFSWITERKLMAWAWAFTILGFVVHTYGFGLRVYLAGRPPVSNMYETVVWVAWGAILFAAILEKVYRSRFLLLAGVLAGVVSLIIADAAPAVLDPSLMPLEAVLRSNFWLIIHVMTITISYAAFALAFILGDIGLIFYLRDPAKKKAEIKALVNGIYRSIQIGVAFLTPGIILGGVWADYSWGRFWGWDPKETWALIVLLGYIAVLHGRLTNWIKDFGMIASAVAAFALVVMAWYGVNFVLGAGLHSYGFGAGGVEYVSVVVGLHLLLLLYVWILERNRHKAS